MGACVSALTVFALDYLVSSCRLRAACLCALCECAEGCVGVGACVSRPRAAVWGPVGGQARAGALTTPHLPPPPTPPTPRFTRTHILALPSHPPPPPTLQICYPTCTVTDVAAKELETVSVAEGSVHYSLDEGGA